LSVKVTIFVGVYGEMVNLTGNWNQRLCFHANTLLIAVNDPKRIFAKNSIQKYHKYSAGLTQRSMMA